MEDIAGDISSNSDDDFPSNAEFVKDEEKAIPWRDVECNVPFKVLQMDEVTTVNGKAMIVKLQKRDNTIVKAWTTKIIKENLLKTQACKENKKNMYILSRGKTIAKKSQNCYYDFKILWK